MSTKQKCTTTWLLVVSILSSIAVSVASDAEILLELASIAISPITGWSANNVANLCSNWSYVECNSNGRVSSLLLTGAFLQGRLPRSIVNLTEIEKLSLQHTPIFGDFPEEMWLLPKVVEIRIDSTGLDIKFPPVLSPTVEVVRVSSAHVVGRLPDLANWDAIREYAFTSTTSTCPLPPGLVAHFKAGGTVSSCRLKLNFFTVDENDLLCGQIPISNTTCDIFPSAHRPRFYPTNDIPTPSNFSVTFGNLSILLHDDEASVFTTFVNRAGQRVEYKGEYLSIKSFPLSEQYKVPGKDLFRTFGRPRWSKFVLETPTKLRVNTSTIDGVLIMESIFEYKNDRSNPYLKLSYAVYNLGIPWKNMTENIPARVGFGFAYNYVLKYSPETGPAPSCTRGSLFYSNCTSSVALLESNLDFATGDVILHTRTSKIETTSRFFIAGSLDGQRLGFQDSVMAVGREFWPVPTAAWLETVDRAGYIPPITSIPESEQCLSAPVDISIPPFQSVFNFDPDVSITLLFDPEAGLAPETTDEAAATSTTVITIVVVVVVVVVIAAGVTLFATVIFPYLNRRDADGQSASLEEEDSKEGIEEDAAVRQTSWRAVKPSV